MNEASLQIVLKATDGTQYHIWFEPPNKWKVKQVEPVRELVGCYPIIKGQWSTWHYLTTEEIAQSFLERKEILK